MHLQYINLLCKSWITRHHTWYHCLSRKFFIKRAVLAKKIGGVLVVGVFWHVIILPCIIIKLFIILQDFRFHFVSKSW